MATHKTATLMASCVALPPHITFKLYVMRKCENVWDSLRINDWIKWLLMCPHTSHILLCLVLQRTHYSQQIKGFDKWNWWLTPWHAATMCRTVFLIHTILFGIVNEFARLKEKNNKQLRWIQPYTTTIYIYGPTVCNKRIQILIRDLHKLTLL